MVYDFVSLIRCVLFIHLLIFTFWHMVQIIEILFLVWLLVLMVSCLLLEHWWAYESGTQLQVVWTANLKVLEGKYKWNIFLCLRNPSLHNNLRSRGSDSSTQEDIWCWLVQSILPFWCGMMASKGHDALISERIWICTVWCLEIWHMQDYWDQNKFSFWNQMV